MDPDVAVPLFVPYATVTVPVDPPFLTTLITIEPAVSFTVYAAAENESVPAGLTELLELEAPALVDDEDIGLCKSWIVIVSVDGLVKIPPPVMLLKPSTSVL